MMYKRVLGYSSPQFSIQPWGLVCRKFFNFSMRINSCWKNEDYPTDYQFFIYISMRVPLPLSTGTKLLSQKYGWDLKEFEDEKITASDYVKSKGIKSLKVVSELTGQSTQTLNNWFNSKPKLFNIVVSGVVSELFSC